MDIQGMSWCPSPFNVFEKSDAVTNAEGEEENEDNKKEELLLAVASKDKTFTVWNARSGSKTAEIGQGRRSHYNTDKYANVR